MLFYFVGGKFFSNFAAFPFTLSIGNDIRA
uniref:Uncharacterized protein n=1 Tax=Siphoviridae sp. ctOCb13 TaxID=2825477 RepID=A0A8S5Q145_9CAUD|nr:MAG TPA: hypothetical protein [Siphoviridae sp. ctOCb13]